MKGASVGLIVLIVFPVTLCAQSGEHRGLGYAFVGPGVRSPGNLGILHFGGGGEVFLKRSGVGLSAEAGFMGGWQYLREGFGVFSANGSYHLPTAGKLAPFATGGYTAFARYGAASLFNIGGGIHVWLRPRFGLRFEVRDHVLNDYGTAHFVSIRFGFAGR